MDETGMSWQEKLFRAYYHSFIGNWSPILGPVPAGYRKAQREKDHAAFAEIMMPYAECIQCILSEDDLDYYRAKYFNQEPPEEWITRRFDKQRISRSACPPIFCSEASYTETDRDRKFSKLFKQADVAAGVAVFLSILSVVISVIC